MRERERERRVQPVRLLRVAKPRAKRRRTVLHRLDASTSTPFLALSTNCGVAPHLGQASWNFPRGSFQHLCSKLPGPTHSWTGSAVDAGQQIVLRVSGVFGVSPLGSGRRLPTKRVENKQQQQQQFACGLAVPPCWGGGGLPPVNFVSIVGAWSSH